MCCTWHTGIVTEMPPEVAFIAAVEDDADRALAAQLMVAQAEARAAAAREIRDKAIRALRRRGYRRHEMVRDIGLPHGVVTNAIRGMERGEIRT